MQTFIVAALAVFVGLLAPAKAGAEAKAYVASNPGVVIDVQLATGLGGIPPEFSECPSLLNPVNTLFGTGFTVGYAHIEDDLYGLEIQDTSAFLYVLSDSFCAEGTRVRDSALDVTGTLESLAYNPDDGFLYTVAFDFEAHLGQLVRIDPTTGATQVVGDAMARDVWVVGLTYDAGSQTLLGVTAGFAARNVQEIFEIDPNTGTAALLGPTGTAPQELQGLSIEDTPAGRLLAVGTSLYEIDRGTGAANRIGGNLAATAYAFSIQGGDASVCDGDCNADREVTVDEILTLVNLAFGNSDPADCIPGDANGDAEITVDEILLAVTNALSGCG